MNRDVREITKSSFLQQVVRSKRKIGLILPRKKNEKMGLELQWVVLCVHNDQVPFLEWYPNDQAVGAHRPLKVLDLLECQSVTNIMEGANRSFLVTFKDVDRPQIELAAMSSNDRDEWVQILTYTLSRLECLDPSSNLYTPLPTLTGSRPSTSLLDDDEEGNERSPPPRLSFPMPLLPNYGHVDLDGRVPLPDDVPRYMAPPPPTAPPEIEFNNYEHINQGVHLMPHIEEGSSAESAKAPNNLSNGNEPMPGRISQAGRPTSSRSSSNMESASIRRREERPPLPPRQSDSIRASSLSSLGRRSTAQSDQFTSHYDIPRTSMTPLYDVLPPISESYANKRSSSGTTATTTTSDSCSLSQSSRPTSTVDSDTVFEGNTSNRASPLPLDSNSLYENAHSTSVSARGRSLTDDDDFVDRYQSLTSPSSSAYHPLPTSPVRLSTVPPPPTCIDSPPPLPPRGNLDRAGMILDHNMQPLYSETRETLSRRQQSSSRQHEVDVVRMEMARTVKVQISLGDCVEGLALVEIDQRLWVAGWSQQYDKKLSAAFHIGDQVVAVNSTRVTSGNQLPAIFYATNTPGLPITFDVNRVPNGELHFITKKPNQQIGIVFAKGKNKMSSVEAGSAAAEAGIEANVKSFTDPSKTSPSVLTEINGRPVNLFAKNNDLIDRLATVDGEITVMIQPYDFVKALKMQLKTKVKNYKQYVVA